MKQESIKKRIVSILGAGIFALMAVVLFLPAMETQAASEKSKALKAYKKMLAQNEIVWYEDGYKIPLRNSKFGLAYIDKDNVPELIVYNAESTLAVSMARIYTYKKGKTVLVGGLKMADSSYYKKTGIFADIALSSGNKVKTFYKMSGTTSKSTGLIEICTYNANTRKYDQYIYRINKAKKGLVETTKAQFNKKLKKLVGSRKATPLKLYKNTKKNRNKYLK